MHPEIESEQEQNKSERGHFLLQNECYDVCVHLIHGKHLHHVRVSVCVIVKCIVDQMLCPSKGSLVRSSN